MDQQGLVEQVLGLGLDQEEKVGKLWPSDSGPERDRARRLALIGTHRAATHSPTTTITHTKWLVHLITCTL